VVLEEVEDSEQVIERIAALDIGKAGVTCCVRLPSQARPGRRRQEVSTWSTMTRQLLRLADRLQGLGVTRVVMEATSDYWKPVFYVLEAAGLETWLVNARDVKHLPGRPKSDTIDAVWLCKVAERQMIRPSFVPPVEIRRLRDLTRYRVDLIGARTAEKNRAEKFLEDAGIKVSVVASDLFGMSGRDMMRALIAGEREPQVLADLARSRLRSKIPVLVEAFTGYFTSHHAFLLGKMLDRVEGIEADIAELDTKIETELGDLTPFTQAVDRLADIPGIGQVAAHALLAEIGLDMTRFPNRRTPVLLAEIHPDHPRLSRQDQRQEHHRARQPLRRTHPGRSRPRSRTHQHLPRRTLPPPRPPPRQKESPRRRRQIHPGHHLAPAVQPRSPLPRPRRRLLRHPHPPRPHQTPPHPPTPSTRLHRHPPTHRLTHQR
jgi:transposase